MAATRYPGAEPASLYAELRRRIAEDKIGVFVGFEDQWVPRALAVTLLPDSPLMMAPQCLIVYSEGSRMLTRHVGMRVRKWIMAAGYDRVLGIGFNHSMAAWARGLRGIGDARPLGELFECKF